MIKLNKKNSLIFSAITFALGIICLIFSKATTTLEFLSCVFFSIAFYMFGRYTKFAYYRKLIELDKYLDNALKDVEINKEKSEYYGFSEIDKNVAMKKFIKKNKYKFVIFYIMAVAIALGAIFMLF